MAGARSLGDFLVRAGLIDQATHDAAVLALRERLRNGTPTSLGRILLERGVASTRILAVATSGERATAVRCDACSTSQPVPVPAPTREFPCARCGAFLLPLGPVMDGSGGSTIIDKSVLPLPGPTTPGAPIGIDSQDTTVAATFRTTLRFDGVLPLPAPATPVAPPTPLPDDHSGSTLAFNKVLPIPPGRAIPAVPTATAVSEAPTMAIPAAAAPALALPGPIGSRGVPPTFNSPPGPFAPPPRGAAPHAPPPQPGLPPLAQGIPPVIQDARLSSSTAGRAPGPPPAAFGVDSEAPTVADREGSAGAFGPAAMAALAAPGPAASANRSTVDEKNPHGSRERRRGGSRLAPRAQPSGSSSRTALIVFVAFLSTLALVGLAALVYLGVRALATH